MSARRATPPPDMGGLDDLQRILALRKQQAGAPETAEDDATTSRDHDATEEAEATPPKAPGRPSAGRKGRRVAGRPRAPRVAEAVALTVRFDPAEADEIDRYLLDLRTEIGRRRLDKAEVVRELLRQAREHEPTRRALIRRLKA